MRIKKGLLTLIILAFAGVFFISIGVLIASDVPDDVSIENDGYKKDKKGPVALSHLKHNQEYKVVCVACHHVYEDGKNIWKEGDPTQKCSECHDPLKKQEEVLKLQLAYHKNCKSCHKKAIVDGKKDAPYKKCTGCHAKK